MKHKHLLPTLLFAFALAACGGSDDDGYTPGPGEKPKPVNVNENKNITTSDYRYGRFEFPKLSNTNSVVIIHTTNDNVDPDRINYCVEWDYQKKSQRWSCYQLTKSTTKQNTRRYEGNPQYPIDPDLARINSTYYFDRPSSDYVTGDYFWGSGFDHGHICPSYDRLYSREANYQTFYLTNMQPQYNKFNAGLWLNMENFVQKVASSLAATDTMWVCRGGTIGNVTINGVEEYGILQYIKDKLIAPKFFFSTFIIKKNGQYGAFAFWALNENKDRSNEYLNAYTLSIDELEKRTGIDFFCNFTDELENKLEAMTAENINTAWQNYGQFK
jgi:endonuclease G